MVMLAAIVVMLTTVVPWLIVKMIQQGVADFRRYQSKSVCGQSVVPELLDNSISNTRIGRYRSPRISE